MISDNPDGHETNKLDLILTLYNISKNIYIVQNFTKLMSIFMQQLIKWVTPYRMYLLQLCVDLNFAYNRIFIVALLQILLGRSYCCIFATNDRRKWRKNATFEKPPTKISMNLILIAFLVSIIGRFSNVAFFLGR